MPSKPLSEYLSCNRSVLFFGVRFGVVAGSSDLEPEERPLVLLSPCASLQAEEILLQVRGTLVHLFHL
jgi:hypothetical protein